VVEPVPQRTATYIGRFTDTRRWDSFQARNDDIFICTPPKCGTTWTQAICAFLIFDTPEYEGKLSDISPWIDGTLDKLDDCLTTLESQQHRRFIKTHTALDGVPYFPACQYLMVYRDPRDTYFSLRNQGLNMINPPDIPQYSADLREGFLAWVETPYKPGVADQRSLHDFIEHYKSFKKFEHLENFHFLHYADMKRDLKASMQGIAQNFDIRISDNSLSTLCHAASFTEMKKNASAYAPASGKSVLKSDEFFFRSGQNAQWRDALHATDLEIYDNKIRQLLPPGDVAWLENGSEES
jgi:aryl sulfotransferase